MEARKPGAITSVTAAPPTIPRRSSTSDLEAAARQVIGADEAIVAAPTTTAS
jgi:hypothetical protein